MRVRGAWVWCVVLAFAAASATARDPAPEPFTRGLLFRIDAPGEARARRMAVVGLELADEQMAAFDAIPVASQVAMLRWTLANDHRLGADREAAIEAWLAGDLRQLYALMLAPAKGNPALAPHLQQVMKHLVDNRNVQMAHRLFLPLRDGRVFVAVGAMHLYGRHGLLALIRDQGYRITRVY